MSRSWSRGEAGGVPVGGSDASTRRPCERTSGCTHLENRLKYRDLDDPRFWTRLYVGRSATVDKTQVFRTRRSTRKRCVHPLVRTQGPITTGLRGWQSRLRRVPNTTAAAYGSRVARSLSSGARSRDPV